MTRNEATRIVKLIARPHNAKVDSELVEVWFNSVLAHVSYETALVVARKLTSAAEYMPKPKHFNDLLRVSVSAQRKTLPATEVPGVWAPNLPLARNELAAMRKKLRHDTARPDAEDPGRPPAPPRSDP